MISQRFQLSSCLLGLLTVLCLTLPTTKTAYGQDYSGVGVLSYKTTLGDTRVLNLTTGLNYRIRFGAEDLEWSLDGTQIIYIAGGTDITIAKIAGGPDAPAITGIPRVVYDGLFIAAKDPSFSPDGTQFAFIVGAKLWVGNSDGSASLTQITFVPSDNGPENKTFNSVHDIDWGPDGVIYFTASKTINGITISDIFSIASVGLVPTQISNQGAYWPVEGGCTSSQDCPAGQGCIAGGQCVSFTCSVDGCPSDQWCDGDICKPIRDYFGSYLSVSPDGNTVYAGGYNPSEPRRPNGFPNGMFSLPTSGASMGGATKIFNTDVFGFSLSGGIVGLAVSPDNQYLAFSRSNKLYVLSLISGGGGLGEEVTPSSGGSPRHLSWLSRNGASGTPTPTPSPTSTPSNDGDGSTDTEAQTQITSIATQLSLASQKSKGLSKEEKQVRKQARRQVRGAIRALIQLAKNDASVFDTCSTLSLKKLKNAQKRAKKARNSAKRWKKLSNFFSRITAC